MNTAAIKTAVMGGINTALDVANAVHGGMRDLTKIEPILREIGEFAIDIISEDLSHAEAALLIEQMKNARTSIKGSVKRILGG